MDSNTWLATVIAVKMLVTIGWIAGCWSPANFLKDKGVPLGEPLVFLRLLGMAYAGLLAGYAIGFLQVLDGRPAPATVGAGIVSNGGACLWLVYFAFVRKDLQSWGSPARQLVYVSAAVVAVITVGLIAFGGRGLLAELASLWPPGR